METPQERVAAGAKFLDAKCPGWADKIDTKKLDIGDGSKCILGQLYGYYIAGTMALDLEPKEPEKFGFVWLDAVDLPADVDEEMDTSALSDAWIHLVDERRLMAA